MASRTKQAKLVNKRKKTKSGKNRKRATRAAVRQAADAKVDVL